MVYVTTCNLCRGRGNLFIVQDRVKEWYTCPACDGFGVRHPIMPATISISGSQQKIITKAETARKKDNGQVSKEVSVS